MSGEAAEELERDALLRSLREAEDVQARSRPVSREDLAAIVQEAIREGLADRDDDGKGSLRQRG